MLAWSPDGTLLAIAHSGDSAVTLWDVREARQRAVLEEPADVNRPVFFLAWSADGKQLMVTTHLAVRIWDVAGARLVRTLDSQSAEDQVGRCAAAWSPDGKRIATLCNDRKVKVFDSTGKAVMSGDFGYAGDSLPAIAWSPDGCHVAGSWYAGSSVLNAATGGLRECNTVDFVRWSDRGMALSWSKDSARVFSTHVTGTVIAMNLRSRKPLWQLTGRAPGLDSTDICISPDGRQYATAVAYDRLYTWDAMQGALAYDYGLVFPPWDHVAWSNDGRLAVAGRGRIWETGGRVWDPGEPGPPHFCRDEGFGCAAWSPDGKTLARGGRDLFLWTADSGDPHPVFHSEAKVTNLAWGANGSTLAAGLDNNKVLILETPSGKVLQTLGRAEFEGGIRYLAVLPDGRLVAASHNGVVSVWNSKWETVGALARLTKTVRQGGDMVRADIDVNNGATSAGGTTIALATSDGIVLWDADKQAVGKTVGTGPMYSVAWSLPLHRLFADQGDRLVIYDEPSGELLASQVIWWGPGKHLLLSPEGHMRCSPAMSEDVVYVALTDDGRQLTLRPNEFAAKYGWRNDPDKIRLSSGAAADEKHGGPAEKAPGAATAPPSPSAPETLPLNRLVDILPKVDLERDTVSGAWTKNDAGVASTVWGSSIMLPVEVDGDYDLIVMFTRHRSNHYGSKTCPCVIFPVAAKKCALVLSEGDQFTGLEMIDGNSAGSGPATTRDKMLVNEQRYNVHLKVRLRERLGTIGVLLDQDPYLHWQGDVASLDIPPRFAMPRPRAIGLAAGCLATFHSVQLRLVSGKASWATSAKPPGPAFPPGPQHEREVAEWVLSVGGGLDIETADGSVQRNVKSLPSLPFWVSALCLRKPEIHDCDLRRLRGLERLKMINLSASTTDETLKVLSDLPTLENVTLWWRANTDEGLKRLGRLKKLKFLGFEGSQLTDDALASFSDLEDADFLQFGRTFIKGPGLVHLAKMSKMTRLWLYCTPIDDAGLAHLPELKGLTAIRLSETKVSDAGLKELYRLPALRELYVEKTEVTGKGLFRLHEALPACTFYADPPAMEEYHTLLLGKGPEKIGLHK
jgi:WD40 repeat protein